mmetsp:Transcript_31823/g.99985  ORF Transcript_31823/g.99985 Transcript_31823/m.99985 type:complete len:224 (-) Transcript_31823:79-750(-)
MAGQQAGAAEPTLWPGGVRRARVPRHPRRGDVGDEARATDGHVCEKLVAAARNQPGWRRPGEARRRAADRGQRRAATVECRVLPRDHGVQRRVLALQLVGEHEKVLVEPVERRLLSGQAHRAEDECDGDACSVVHQAHEPALEPLPPPRRERLRLKRQRSGGEHAALGAAWRPSPTAAPKRLCACCTLARPPGDDAAVTLGGREVPHFTRCLLKEERRGRERR